MDKALLKAIEACPEFIGKGPDGQKIRHEAGTISALAAHLGISRGAVCQWKKVPSERVVDVESVTGVPREVLLPHLFGGAARRPRARATA